MKVKKICQICGKEFIGNPNQKYCSPRHDFPCPVCGKIQKNKLNKQKNSKCKECASKKVEKICEICGKKFMGTLSQRYCSPRHDFPCPRCGKIRKNILNNKKHQHCSECAKKLQEETMMKKYGYKTNLLDPKVQEQIKQTNLKKYGVENVMQSKEIQDRAKKTNLERYGTENAMQSEEIQKKQEKTMMEKYGYKTNLLHPEVQEQIKQTNLERYGVENYAQSEDFKEKIKAIWENKTEEERLDIIKRTKETLIEKYGVDSFSKTDEFKNFMKEWNANLTEEEKKFFQEKKEKTNIERYGFYHPSLNPDVQAKTKKTFKLKYGFPNPTFFNMKHFDEYEKLEETLKNKSRNVAYWADYFNITIGSFRRKVLTDKLQHLVLDFYNLSEPETIFADRMEKAGIDKSLYIMHDRTEIKPLELDFYFPNHNLAVEISPTFTHCYTGFFSEDTYTLGIDDKEYHYKKFRACKDKGIELISVFDWSNTDKIIDFIKDKIHREQEMVYARKTEYREVKELNRENKNFLGSNHILGSINNRQGTFVGELYYENNKVGIAVFTPINTHQIELRRLAFDKRYKVIGGASKLLKNALKGKNYKEVITFSDNDLGTGNVYKTLGFDVLEEKKGSLLWFNEILNKKVTDLSLVKQGTDRILKNIPGYEFVGQGENLPSNQEIIASYGFLPIYDTGYTKWIKRIDKK